MSTDAAIHLHGEVLLAAREVVMRSIYGEVSMWDDGFDRIDDIVAVRNTARLIGPLGMVGRPVFDDGPGCGRLNDDEAVLLLRLALREVDLALEEAKNKWDAVTVVDEGPSIEELRAREQIRAEKAQRVVDALRSVA